MKPKASINHVALVLPDIEFTASILRPLGAHIGTAEIFEGEGTKEIYVQKENAASLLLMEPTKPGSYQRALEKRGPSLHHIAIDVKDLDGFISDITDSGWLLHPSSLETIQHIRVAWLARPGFPSLIEVSEVKELSTAFEYVGGILLQSKPENQRFIDALGLHDFLQITNEETELLLDGSYIRLSQLSR